MKGRERRGEAKGGREREGTEDEEEELGRSSGEVKEMAAQQSSELREEGRGKVREREN